MPARFRNRTSQRQWTPPSTRSLAGFVKRAADVMRFFDIALVVLLVGGIAGLALGRVELLLFLFLAGLFALTQSWDMRDRARTGDPAADRAVEPALMGRILRVIVPLVVPMTGVLVYGAIATSARALGQDGAHVAAMQWSIAAAFLCLLAMLPPIQQQLARTFMPGPFPGHTARLTASLTLVLLLLPVPAGLIMTDLIPSTA